MRIHKRITAAVFAAMMCMSTAIIPDLNVTERLISATAASTVWDGTADTSWYDSEEAEMHISTAEEFAGFAKLIAGGTTMEGNKIVLDKTIYLNDPDEMDVDSKTPPTNLWDISGGTFSGIFDGGAHTVYGLYTAQKIWLSEISEGALLSNLSFKDAIIGAPLVETNSGSISNFNVDADAQCSAFLCSENKGTITRCVTDGTLTLTDDDVGCICETNRGIIDNCTNKASVTVSYANDIDASVGGIASYNFAVILNCTNDGKISVTCTKDLGKNNYVYVGGIFAIGGKRPIICENCNNNAAICFDSSVKQNNARIGGIAGHVDGYGDRVFYNCINYGDIQSVASESSYAVDNRGCFAGGISGYSNNLNYEQCGNNGKVIGANFSGGLTGSVRQSCRLDYCYNKGDITGSMRSGGFAGDTYKNNGKATITITNSYNTGSISALSYAGGFVGMCYSLFTSCYSAATSVTGEYAGTLLGSGTILSGSSAYYYLSSGASQAIGNTVGEFGTPKSAANMKKESFVKSLGDAFIYNEGGYPILFWEADLQLLSIDKTELTFNEYNQKNTITCDTTYDGELTWTSSDENIATVDNEGTVTAVGNGTCTITVNAHGYKASCEVTVAYEYFLNETELTMNSDGLAKGLIVYSRSNNKPTTLEVEFTSSNMDVAEVNQSGVISPNAPGTAEIHANVADMDLICIVTVEAARNGPIQLGDVNQDKKVTVADAVMLARIVAEDKSLSVTAEMIAAADFNQDGYITVVDSTELLKQLAGFN